jgi:hypothetical protein
MAVWDVNHAPSCLECLARQSILAMMFFPSSVFNLPAVHDALRALHGATKPTTTTHKEVDSAGNDVDEN